MRIAFVGLSTPLFYDYRNPASRAQSDMSDSPNPILDSPFGLMLLYDEVWFLCRSLCPENMRELPYVKFLDEKKMLPSLKDLDAFGLWRQVEADPALYKRYGKGRDAFFKSYKKTVKRVGVHWSAAPDNHSHGLQIGDVQRSANSVNLENMLFDMEVVRRIERNDIELITNSVSHRWLDDPNSPFVRARLTEILTIEKIPNYLTPQGPYDECIDEARDNSFLKDFRKWISSQTIPKKETEMLQMKRDVERVIRKSEDEIFLKTLDRRTRFLSIGKTAVGAGVGILVPGVSTVVSIAENVKGYFDDGKRRWQGFVVSMRASIGK